MIGAPLGNMAAMKMADMNTEAVRHRAGRIRSNSILTAMALALLLGAEPRALVPPANAQSAAESGARPKGRLIDLLDGATEQARNSSPRSAATGIRAVGTETDGTADAAVLNYSVKQAVDAREASIEARNSDELAAYEARKQADQQLYAAQMAAYQAEVQRAAAQYAAETAAWQARVRACLAGDKSQCGH